MLDNLREIEAAPDAEQNRLRHVAEVETNSTTVRTSVFPSLRPDNHRLVREAPSVQHLKAFGHESIRHPEVAMRLTAHDTRHRHRRNLRYIERVITTEPLVLRSDLAGPVDEPPRRICENRPERLTLQGP